MTSYGAVLRLPGMRAVYAAHTVSMLGTIAAEVALSILVFERTGSPLLSALVLVCSFLPYAVSGVLFASLTDRFPARRVLVTCDLLSAACVGAMLLPGMPVAGLLGLLVGLGMIAPVFSGARAASLANLLPPDLFPVGRSLLRAIGQTAMLAGFALGGIAVAAIGARWLLIVDVLTFGLSAILIGTGTPHTPPTNQNQTTLTGNRNSSRREDVRDSRYTSPAGGPGDSRSGSRVGDAGGARAASPVGDAGGAATGLPGDDAVGEGRRDRSPGRGWAGVRLLFADVRLRNLILLTWVAAAFSSLPDGLAVAYTAQVGTVAAAAGALFTGYAVGGVAGELVVARFTPSVRRRLVVPFLLASQLPAIGFLTVPPIPVAAALLAISGAGFAFNQGIDPLILGAVDPTQRGQLFTIQTSGLMAIQGVSIALGGVVGSFIAPNLTIALAGVLGTATTLLIARHALNPGPRHPPSTQSPAVKSHQGATSASE